MSDGRKTEKEHGTSGRKTGGRKRRSRERRQEEDRRAGTSELAAEGGAGIHKKIAGLGQEEENPKPKEKARFVREIVQGPEFGGKVRLNEALAFAGLAKSTYEYALKRSEKPENPDNLRIREEIKAIWLRSKKRYGYRKILIGLKAGYSERINHKKVLRLMNVQGIHAVLGGHDKRYCSYRGKVGKTAPNILGRDFHADACLRKAGTDVTEFKCLWGKAYFSPVIDFCNDRILHSDQGWQYQMEAYRNRLAEYGIIQSMSRKGNCLDNSKTENLFSKRKKEMFYGHEKEFRSFAELKKSIDEYVDWYNNERIVQRLGGAPVSNRSIEPVPLLCYSPT